MLPSITKVLNGLIFPSSTINSKVKLNGSEAIYYNRNCVSIGCLKHAEKWPRSIKNVLIKGSVSQ